MPAIRAVASTSPVLALPDAISASVALLMITRPSATAVRSVAGLADTSTIRASPLASMWVRAAFDAPDFAFDGRRAISAGPSDDMIARDQRTRRRGNVGLPHEAF